MFKLFNICFEFINHNLNCSNSGWCPFGSVYGVSSGVFTKVYDSAPFIVDLSYYIIYINTFKLLLCSLKKKVRLFGSISKATLNFSPILNFSLSFLSFNHISNKFLLSLIDNTTPITLSSSNSSPIHANNFYSFYT